MPSRAHVEWNGDALIERVRNAAAESVDETVDVARDDAKITHTWLNDPRARRFGKGGPAFDSDLELEIKSEHANAGDSNPTAKFGYTKDDGFYGLFHETGTVHEHEYPALRPAGDRAFPTLAERIRRRLK